MAGPKWTEKYKSKILGAEGVIKKIKRGSRIFLGTGCGVPYHLVQELAKYADTMSDNEIVHLIV